MIITRAFPLVVLILLLFVGEPVLQWWFGPAMNAFQFTRDAVSGYLIPSAAQWLQ